MKRQLQNNNENIVEMRKSELFSGPLPHPEILGRYDMIVPGAAERIIKMAENQSSHRIELERNVINSDIANSKRGQLFGFIISMLGILSSCILILFNHEVVGGVLGGTTLVSLVSVFLYGTRTRSLERNAKGNPLGISEAKKVDR